MTWDVDEVVAVARGGSTILVTALATLPRGVGASAVGDARRPSRVVLGGEHLEEGIEAIQSALEDEVLRPHYAVIEARRVATLDQRGGQKIRASVHELIGDGIVMSESEKAKMAELVGDGGAQGAKAQAKAGAAAASKDKGPRGAKKAGTKAKAKAKAK